MARQRRASPRESELKAVGLITDQGHDPVEVAGDLDLSERRLQSWKRDLAADGERALPSERAV